METIGYLQYCYARLHLAGGGADGDEDYIVLLFATFRIVEHASSFELRDRVS